MTISLQICSNKEAPAFIKFHSGWLTMAVKCALLVDDSKSARLVLSRLLEKNNLHVDLVESAEDALTYLQDHKPDVIFMDHMMPGMDGLEAAKLINTNPQTHDIPVVMCTSKEGEAFTADAKAHGAVDVICKPPSPDAVARVLHLLGEGGLSAGTVITANTLTEAHACVMDTLQEIVPITPEASERVSGAAMHSEEMNSEQSIKTLLEHLLPNLLDEKLAATEHSVAEIQLELKQVLSRINARIDEKMSALNNQPALVDTTYVQEHIKTLRQDLTQLIDERISSLADLINNSSTSHTHQIKEIATAQAQDIVKTEVSALQYSVDQRIGKLSHTLKMLESKSTDEAKDVHTGNPRMFALITGGLSVLAILVSIGTYFLK
jgi:CheY-like chemotaxis protein